MKTLKINRYNLKYFWSFSDENNLKFKDCVKSVYSDSIYFGELSGTYISWNDTEDIEVLKIVVDLINTLLIDCKLEIEEDK